ncbi:hypothetical protein [Cellulomonas biazotea]|uniref:hypothetical protein n=1 Tax=Cellulomonas biazotea TaxID=1709 RepID=UPI0035F06802
MPAATTGPWRLARAGLVASVVVALSAVAHVLGGGVLPHAVVLVALTSLVLAVAVVLAGRRLGVVATTALLGVGQLALHHGFVLLGPVCAPAAATAGPAGHLDHAAHAEHAVHAAHAVQVATAAGSAAGCVVGHAAAQPLLGASAMLVLHAVATVLTAVVVAGADRALHWLVAWLRPRLAVPGPVVVPAVGSLVVPVVPTAVRRAPWARDDRRRGPPAAPPAPPAR